MNTLHFFKEDGRKDYKDGDWHSSKKLHSLNNYFDNRTIYIDILKYKIKEN